MSKRVVEPGGLPRTGGRRAAGRAPGRALAGLLLGALAASACGGEPNRSVVLITLDSTRPDALGTYGHTPEGTPNLDWLGEEGVVFEQAYTVAPLTLPAHASMLTGLYPPRHGLRDDGISSLPQSAVTLAERAKAAGHATAAFLGSAALDAGFGLEQGFDTYDPPARRFYNSTGKADERPAGEVCGRAEQWLGQLAPEQPFFLWVHLRDPHPPHEAGAQSSRAGGDAYQAEVLATDLAVGRLLGALRLREALDPTLVIVAGDHGLARGDHGETGHGDYVWNSTVRVPLIVRRPYGQGGGKRVAEPVSVVDVFATALRGMGLAPEPDVDSRDLLGGGRRTGGVYYESLHGALAYGWQPWTGWVDERGKSMHAARSLLFALDDLAEERDLATARAADVAIHRAGIATVTRAPTLPPDAEGVDAQLREALEAVGYGQASFESQIIGTPETGGGRADPLERVSEAADLHAAETLVNAEDWTAAEARLSALVQRYPENRTGWELLGVVCLRTDRAPRAVELLERALQPGLGRAQTWMRLGKARLVTGDEENALKAFLRALELDPNEVQALGGLLHIMDGAGLEARAAPLRERFEAIQKRDVDAR